MSFAMITGIVGGFISLIAYTPRAIKIIRYNSNSSYTWIIWTLTNFLIFLSLYSLGSRTTIWVPLAYCIGSAMMTVLALLYKAEGWTNLHKWLLAIAILSGIRWWFFSNAFLAMLINIFIYIISYVMIIKAKWHSRNTETWIITWSLYFTGSVLNLLAMVDWSIEMAVYPVTLVVLNGIVFAITLRNYFRISKAKSRGEEILAQ